VTYRFAVTRTDHSDFATGRVFYGLPGHPAFPVRLADEIFQRCLALHGSAAPGGVTLYDPCCGSASLLGAIAYLHWSRVRAVVASDIDPEVLPLAARNLSLLTQQGLEERRAQITTLRALYGKESHAAALDSVGHLQERLAAGLAAHAIPTRLFAADATDASAILAAVAPGAVDLVITDLPYGQRSAWQSGPGHELSAGDALEALLQALRPVLAPRAIVAIVSDKAQRPRHRAYRRAGWFGVGHRRVEFLRMLAHDWASGDPGASFRVE